jgi:hypothetical protein
VALHAMPDRHDALLCLPHDLLAHSLSFLDALSLLAAAQASTALHAAVEDERVWHALRWRNHDAVLRILFDGRVPLLHEQQQQIEPSSCYGWSKRARYFSFTRSWKRLAQQRTGRVLLRIDGAAAGGQPGTCGVYDATTYAPSHPGLEFIIEDAAEEEDSTSTFAAANHSRRAKAILRSLAVPGLECLRCDGEEAVLKARRKWRLRGWYVVRLRRWALPFALLLLALAAGPHEALLGSPVATLARFVPNMAPSDVTACVSAAVCMYEGEGVLTAIALFGVLGAVAMRSAGGFAADLLWAPAARSALALVPVAIALSRRRTSKRPS